MQPTIFEHQAQAFQELCRAGRVCFSPLRSHLPVQPRTNSLLIGPSGSGKSYLARAVAESLGMECKALTVADWMLLGSGSKGAQRTWNAIFDFLLESHSKKGVVIFVDEIDKLTGSSDWVQHLRLEVFRLLDLSIPPDLIDTEERRPSPAALASAQEVLKSRTYIIGAGAFQPLWEEGTRTVGGFAGEREPDSPSPEVLSRYLARELVNRFRAKVVVLRAPAISDYESMLLASAERMPPALQERFLSMGEKRIADAWRNHQGVRFIEELVADLLAWEFSEEVTQTPTRWRWDPSAAAPKLR